MAIYPKGKLVSCSLCIQSQSRSRWCKCQPGMVQTRAAPSWSALAPPFRWGAQGKWIAPHTQILCLLRPIFLWSHSFQSVLHLLINRPHFPPYLREKIKQEWHIPHLPSGLKSDPLTKSCIRQIATAHIIVRDEITLSHFKPCNDLSCMIGISPYMTNKNCWIRLKQIFTCAMYEPRKLARIQGNAIPKQKEKKPEVGRFDGCIAFPAIQDPPG